VTTERVEAEKTVTVDTNTTTTSVGQVEKTVHATATTMTKTKSMCAKYDAMEEDPLKYDDNTTSSSGGKSSTQSEKDERAAKAAAGTMLSGMLDRMPVSPPPARNPPAPSTSGSQDNVAVRETDPVSDSIIIMSFTWHFLMKLSLPSCSYISY